MTKKILEKFLKVKSSTVGEMKNLLEEIKSCQNVKLNEEIEKLKDELKQLKKVKKYGLVWEEKEEEFDKETIGKLPVLKEVKKYDIKNNDSENNILIEGDNYHTLSVLNYTHKGKIDVIYIDPPYNTGNNDDTGFVYNDKIVDKEDRFRHSKWLSFMSKRLRLAHNLLSNDGVIFISIDDNEFAQLKLLCDEIFGIENFITSFIWEKTQHFGRQKINYYSNAEYILVYGKKINENGLKELLVEYIKEEHEDAPLYNAGNNENLLFFPKGTVKFNIQDGKYKKTTNEKYKLNNNVIVKNGFNQNDFSLRFKSRWSQNTINNELKKGAYFLVKSKDFSIRVVYGDGKTSNESPKKIIFTNENNPQNTKSRFGEKVGVTENGSNELNSIVKQNIFNYPKPKSLIKYLLSLIYKNNNFQKDITILDFFAGSGTTGHAVLELNKEDGGNRKFILATNNENNICEEVTYKRLKNVINGYKKVEGLGGNLKYLKTDFIDKHNSNDDLRKRMVDRCSELLCLKENVWEAVILKDIEKNNKIKIFERKDKYLAILYDMFYLQNFIEITKKLENKEISIYAFSHFKLEKDDFEGVKQKFNIEEIPDPILEVYKSIFEL